MVDVRGDVIITNVLGTPPATFVEDWTPAALGPNLVHWWDANADVTFDAGTGKVSAWTDRSALATVATQSTSALQPVYTAGREIRFTGDQTLTMPGLSRSYIEHHWFCLVFRINWAVTSGTDGSFFSVNSTGGGDTRHPFCGWTLSDKTIQAQWKNASGNNSISLPIATEQLWHVLVGRRTWDGVYLSLDGEDEEFLACNSGLNLPNIGIETPSGLIGDFRTANDADFGINSIVIGQRFIDSADVAKLQGWGLWRVGAQAQLPVSHPYSDDAPPNEDPFEEPPDGEDATAYPNFDWSEGNFNAFNRGAALDRTDFLLMFEEDWDDISGITDGCVGLGPWYTPARADTSIAHFRKPTQTFNPFSIDTPSVLTITMQKSGSTWFTGHVQTVDTYGQGFQQKYGYFEARLAFEDVPVAWPAFWLYSVENQYLNDSATRAEIDILECYATDPDGYHGAVHRHPAVRKQPGHLQSNTSYGEIEALSSPANLAIWGISDLFDGNFHTYGCLVSATDIIMYIDDLEVSRAKMYPEADVPLHPMITLQMQDDFVGSAVSPVRMYCDWIKVWALTGGGGGDEGFGAGAGFGEDPFGS